MRTSFEIEHRKRKFMPKIGGSRLKDSRWGRRSILPLARHDKDVSGHGQNIVGQGSSGRERITWMSVKTQLDVFVSFRHALRVRPIPL